MLREKLADNSGQATQMEVPEAKTESQNSLLLSCGKPPKTSGKSRLLEESSRDSVKYRLGHLGGSVS